MTSNGEPRGLELTPAALPHPSRVERARRVLRVLALSARHMTPAVLRLLIRRKGGPAKAARVVFERLGATYVKFGQFVTSASGIVGEPVAQEFRSCLDAGPPVSFREVRGTIEAELAWSLEDAFATFEETPLAAASLAVVHAGTLRDGTPVAVKVLRADIERTIAADLAVRRGGA